MGRLLSTSGFALLAAIALAGCSGIETIPEDTTGFVATAYTDYAWRSEPLTQGGRSMQLLFQADPIIRDAADQRLAELGYRRVPRDEAQFLIEYLAGGGVNEGQLPRSASNVSPIPSMTINRQADGATVDNAYALGGAVDTGNIVIVFVRAANLDPLWRVSISTVIQDRNRVDETGIRRAIRQGLATLPPTP